MRHARAALITLAGVVVFALTLLAQGGAQPVASPELLDVKTGTLTLRAQVWRPAGGGPFPAVLFNHGSYSTDDPLPPSQPDTLGRVFARHGYVFLWLHRQGIGLSRGQGESDGDQMARAREAKGVEGRNRVQLQLLEHEEINEATTALARLRGRADVDTRRLGVVGHSFGGSLSVLLAAREPDVRAMVIFAGAAASWDQSAALRERLFDSVGRVTAPALFVHAANDYSTAPGQALAAEMQRLGKAHALKIYPPFGADARAGHNLVFGSVGTWEADVFAFLDRHLRR
jgi:carboxymethylenebutenolidase